MSRAFPDTLLDFQRMFPDEEACAKYLEELRWPQGFVCPSCNLSGEAQRIQTRPRVLRCRECLKDTSLTAGTVMQDTRTPLQVWFWGAYLVTSQTPGMSAVQFQRQLGVGRYETAFQILHKLRAAMVRPDRDKIGGSHAVEADETLIGGETRGEGRGIHGKEYVVGAVEVRRAKQELLRARRQRQHDKSRPVRGDLYAGRIRLRHVPNRSGLALTSFVAENIKRGTMVVTDGYTGYDALKRLGYDHQPVTVGGDHEITEAALPLIHLIFSNLQTWLLGTHHGVSPKHLQAYLNEYTFRFNRRFYPMGAFNSVLGIGVRATGPTYDSLYAAPDDKGRWAHPNPGDEHNG